MNERTQKDLICWLRLRLFSKGCKSVAHYVETQWVGNDGINNGNSRTKNVLFHSDPPIDSPIMSRLYPSGGDENRYLCVLYELAALCRS